MRSYIKVSEDLRKTLREGFNVSNVTVWKALTNLSNTHLARKIRQYALDHGGQWVKEVAFVPACKTQHYPDGSWIQELANGVDVLFTGKKAIIRQDGNAIDSYEDVTLETWGNVLCHAQAVAEGNFEAMCCR